MSKIKDLKSRDFVVISLQTDLLFNFTLKDMYYMSYIQSLFFWKTVHLMDSGFWSVS